MIRKMGEHPEKYVQQPGRDFIRPRTLSFETVIYLLLTMSENSIGKVLIGRFQDSEKTPSALAFVQQRQKPLHAELIPFRFPGENCCRPALAALLRDHKHQEIAFPPATLPLVGPLCF